MTFITERLNTACKKRILFLNPMGTTSQYWLQNLQIHNSFENFELVFLDYPGYASVDFYYVESLQKLAREIADDLQQLNSKETIVIGFSYGGNVAICLTEYLSIHKMVLIGTNPYIHKNEIKFYEYLENSLKQNGLYDFSTSLLNFCYNRKEKESNPFLHLTLYASLRLNVNQLALEQQLDHLKNNVGDLVLQKNTLIPLIIIGEDDETVFEDIIDRYNVLFKDIIFKEFSDAGHFVLDYNQDSIEIIKEYIN
ncbi:alpha/beta fold hydrolase [Flavobacterium sp. GT3R68]|uniref:alpha/beta fold hydrolase n=1 Tax=Flavobacterium sp. GT3R68 TaxID=2594437 RepID=UPI0013157E90|nr:alpha/beta hydrolase [Flavobacterium sp. GT3R68]